MTGRNIWMDMLVCMNLLLNIVLTKLHFYLYSSAYPARIRAFFKLRLGASIGYLVCPSVCLSSTRNPRWVCISLSLRKSFAYQICDEYVYISLQKLIFRLQQGCSLSSTPNQQHEKALPSTGNLPCSLLNPKSMPELKTVSIWFCFSHKIYLRVAESFSFFAN